MQNWIIVDENYLNAIRFIEPRIPYSDYGKNKFKPFFGALFGKDEIMFVSQISHAQSRHTYMKNAPDFVKIFICSEKSNHQDRLAAVVNLNYMFPVPKALIQYLKYCNINQCRNFASLEEQSKYIDLLKKEMIQLNKLNIDKKAQKLYERKLSCPEDIISKRCVDFVLLEKFAIQYISLNKSPEV